VAKRFSREQFEVQLTLRTRSIERLFKVFDTYKHGPRKGQYVRDETQSLWEGWQMHEEYLAHETEAKP
jgi:hypothetical protein